MSQNRPRYLSYLIRLWQVKVEQKRRWRASLESPVDGKRHTFPGLDQMIAFLRAQTDHQELDGKEEESDE